MTEKMSKNIKNVELDVGVSDMTSEVRKDVSLRRYGPLKFIKVETKIKLLLKP